MSKKISLSRHGSYACNPRQRDQPGLLGETPSQREGRKEIRYIFSLNSPVRIAEPPWFPVGGTHTVSRQVGLLEL